MAEWLTDWLTEWLTDLLIDGPTDKHFLLFCANGKAIDECVDFADTLETETLWLLEALLKHLLTDNLKHLLIDLKTNYMAVSNKQKADLKDLNTIFDLLTEWLTDWLYNLLADWLNKWLID